MTRISALDVVDVRFPTSRWLDGSDAMNPEPDYSAAYLLLRTDDPDLTGYSLLFTTGRGNDVACAAVRALAPYVVGRDVAELAADIGALARAMTWDGQLRWLGPEKGVMHMAIGAVVNAAWDLRSRLEGAPLWQILSELDPEEIVRQIDFTYIDDAMDARGSPRAARGSRRTVVPSGPPCSSGMGWPPTRPRPGGSATTTPRWSDSCERRWRMASPC